MNVTRADKTRSRSAKPEAAQDIVFAWLKKHVVSLPRTDSTFLTEAEVCRATGMSRTPVREALLRLEADGFLQIVPKKGAFVPPITEREVEAIMQARGLVEDFCVRRAVHLANFWRRNWTVCWRSRRSSRNRRSSSSSSTASFIAPSCAPPTIRFWRISMKVCAIGRCGWDFTPSPRPSNAWTACWSNIKPSRKGCVPATPIRPLRRWRST